MAATDNTAAPVFMLVRSNQCSHCHVFVSKHWNNVKKALSETRPDIRIEDVMFKSFDSQSYDRKKYPAGVAWWGKFFPTFALIPGELWDRALKDPKVTMTIADGAEGMNMTLRDGELSPVRGYAYDKT